MKITHELLAELGADDRAISFFDKHFPFGATPIEVLQMRHLPFGIAHWGRINLSLNDEEIAAYEKFFNIENSKSVAQSSHVNGSEFVVNSNYITRCSYIKDSNSVVECVNVLRSDDIKESAFIYDSTFVENSSEINKSNYVVNSENIYKSVQVFDSENISNSSHIYDSNLIENCHDMTGCDFCRNCSGLTDSMFCFGVKDGRFLIFNKPVPEKIYNLFKTQIRRFVNFRMRLPSLEGEFSLLLDFIPMPARSEKLFVNANTKEFLNWVKTLPNYDSDIIFSITESNFFKNKI